MSRKLSVTQAEKENLAWLKGKLPGKLSLSGSDLQWLEMEDRNKCMS